MEMANTIQGITIGTVYGLGASGLVRRIIMSDTIANP